MFFILSKILSIFTQPFFWAMLCFFLAYLFRHKMDRRILTKWGIIILLIFSNTAIFTFVAGLWEDEGQNIDAVGHYDVAVVLGGMAEFDKKHDRLSIRRGGDRIWQALHLYHLGKVDKILISGDNGFISENGLHEAAQFKAVLTNEGIPSSDILVEVKSKNTHENAIESKKILDQHLSDPSVLLVTSALHMPRSKACFEKVGFNNLSTFSTDHYKTQGISWDQYLAPNASNFTSWNSLLHEWVGYSVYWVMGYL